MARQHDVSGTTTIAELVPENPRRTGLWLQNTGSATFSVTVKQDTPDGGILIYPLGYVYMTRDQECDKQWWFATLLSTGDLSVVEFFEARRRG